MSELGDWLAQARRDSGVSYAEATFRIRALLPSSMWVSLETIRRLEGRPAPDPVLAVALATVYGKEPEEWPEVLRTEAAQVERLLSLLPLVGATRTVEVAAPTASMQGVGSSPCNVESFGGGLRLVVGL